MSRPITSKKIKSKRRRDSKINLISLQNIRRYVVSWIVVVVMIVVIQLMVLFDVIHVVNKKSPEASDKSFLYTALEVFCLGESFRRIFKSNFRWKSSGLHLVCEYLSTELNYRHPPDTFLRVMKISNDTPEWLYRPRGRPRLTGFRNSWWMARAKVFRLFIYHSK